MRYRNVATIRVLVFAVAAGRLLGFDFLSSSRSLGSSSMKTVSPCTSLVPRKAGGGIATTSPAN